MDNENNFASGADDSWDDITIEDSNIILEDDGGATTENADGSANQQGNVGNDGGDQGGSETKGSEDSDQSFKLKYLGAEREVNREEVISYAQKGMDYDRIRSKYNEAQEALNTVTEQLKAYESDTDALNALKELAKSQEIDFNEFVIQSIAAVNASKNGTSVKAELPKVRLDFERKAFEKQKSDWEKGKGKDNNEQKQTDIDGEIQSEIDEFTAAFPDAAADAKVIPREVWDAKNADPKKSLTQHYKDYLDKQKDAEIADLKARLEQAEQNALNKYRSTGAQNSASVGDGGGDIWEREWELA